MIIFTTPNGKKCAVFVAHITHVIDTTDNEKLGGSYSRITTSCGDWIYLKDKFEEVVRLVEIQRNKKNGD